MPGVFWVVIYRAGGGATHCLQAFAHGEATRWVARHRRDGDRLLSDQPGLSIEEAAALAWAQGLPVHGIARNHVWLCPHT